MKVKAIAKGYFGSLRDTGDVFEVPTGTAGSWFAPVDDAPVEAVTRRGRPPKSDETAE